MAPRKRVAAPVVEDDVFEEVDEIEELEDPADDLEELEEEPAPVPVKRTRKATAAPAKATPTKAATKTAPTKRAPAPAATDEASEYDSNWLASYVTEETGMQYDGRSVRMLLRKLAKNGAFAREIGTDRSRYTFPKGANDPIVRQVIKMVRSGEAATIKREGLETVKANKAAAAPTKTTKAAPAKAAPTKATTRRRRATAE